ncbi:FAD-binding oxidoreductase [Gloeocapsopsis crepidinum LEGE 06123]|uniref:FAD-binding oxidoreductase n=2 Tax=Gloeocapsopsis crepidinum TaxID=693223 RepID=A0ABR9V0E5_9CHRO|nr:FAD-binding oxidoreductase [Gloeocapsopsis crepidinum]MBE9192983.1 FAD-binding oxidoreductase [Gloeocapsopsis crepidinum LEGE 06123]
MTVQTNQAALDELRRDFTGEIVVPENPAYNEARTIFNAMIDKHPSVIAQCATVDDVVRAVQFGRDFKLEIAVRGGGHSVAGKALTDDGLVIDLRRMNAVSVDPDARIVTVGGGATMSHLDRATEPYGLATTGGRVSTTGVGGFTLGGGDGWLARKMGLACDNLLAVELVTAEGDVVYASENKNSELFWALHGGGGNFGIVTSFTFRLHELPLVTAALLLWRPETGPNVLRAYREFMASAPDEVGGGALYVTGPTEDFVPKYLVGRLAFVILVVYAGSEAEAREITAPLLALGHEGEFIAEMPYAELQCMLDDPPGYRNYWSAEYLEAFPNDAVDRFCDRANDMIVPSPSQQVLIPQGGMIARGPSDYPIPWRHAPWCVHPFGLWKDPADDERARQWVRDIRADFEPWASGAVYLNFIGDEGRSRVVAGFGQENYQKLAKVKAQYDPDNVFHLNHNIKPM